MFFNELMQLLELINACVNSSTTFSELLKDALKPAFDDYGLMLEGFWVQSLSLPEELQGHLDKVASMTMIGEVSEYQFLITSPSGMILEP